MTMRMSPGRRKPYKVRGENPNRRIIPFVHDASTKPDVQPDWVKDNRAKYQSAIKAAQKGGPTLFDQSKRFPNAFSAIRAKEVLERHPELPASIREQLMRNLPAGTETSFSMSDYSDYDPDEADEDDDLMEEGEINTASSEINMIGSGSTSPNRKKGANFDGRGHARKGGDRQTPAKERRQERETTRRKKRGSKRRGDSYRKVA